MQEKIIELNGTFSEICIGFLFLFLFFYFLIHGFACPPFSFFSSLTPNLTPHAIKLYPYRDVYFDLHLKLLERTYLSCCNAI